MTPVSPLVCLCLGAAAEVPRVMDHITNQIFRARGLRNTACKYQPYDTVLLMIGLAAVRCWFSCLLSSLSSVFFPIHFEQITVVEEVLGVCEPWGGERDDL